MSTLDALDTWDELEPWRMFTTLDGYAFDLLFLVKAVTTQLNQMKSNNPYPVYPFNPFTKGTLRIADLRRLVDAIQHTRVVGNAPLCAFLDSPELWSEDDAWTSSAPWIEQCVSVFKGRRMRMRFVRDIEHFSDGDGSDVRLVGYWNLSTTEITSNEYWAMIFADDPYAAMELDNLMYVRQDLIPFTVPDSYYARTPIIIKLEDA
jgi:hypothetical protein